MGVELTAALSDDDTAMDISWKWYKGSSEIIGTTGTGETSTYDPGEGDIGSRLTAKATYTDAEDANNKKMAEATTRRTVRRAPESNNAPAFPDQNLLSPRREHKEQDAEGGGEHPCGKEHRSSREGE